MTPEIGSCGSTLFWLMDHSSESNTRELIEFKKTIRCLAGMAHKRTDLKQSVRKIVQFVEWYNLMLLIKKPLKRLYAGMISDLKWIERRRNHPYASNFLDYVLMAFSSDRLLDEFLHCGGRVLKSYKDEIWDGVLPSELTQEAFTVAVAAVLHLLASVFQYIVGCIDRAGSKTYSSSCLDFRDSFVSLLLFHGAYVWIKFRQAARPPTGKRKATNTQPEHPGGNSHGRSKFCARASKNGSATKYEARYTIRKDKLDDDHPVRCNRLSLGLYESDVEASFVSHVARTYYEVDHGEACCVELDGVKHNFCVPRMSEQEQELVGEDKRQLVISKSKEVGQQKYAEFRKEQSDMATDTRSSDPSPSRETCQPFMMRGHTGGEPLSAFDAPSRPGPIRYPCEETVGAKLTLEGSVVAEGVEPEWLGKSQSFDGNHMDFTSGFTDEDFETMCGGVGFFSAPQQESTRSDITRPCSDSSHFESWSLQNFQHFEDAGVGVDQFSDRTGSGFTGVEQSELVLYGQQPQGFFLQSWATGHPQSSEIQILEHSQQISDRWEEKVPSDSISQPYERLLKENQSLREEIERLQKEKERSDQEKELLKSKLRQLLL